MKLITEKGELALPADFQFDIEENNPFFSQEGAQSHSYSAGDRGTLRCKEGQGRPVHHLPH